MDRQQLIEFLARRFANVFGFHRDESYSFEHSDHPQGETCWVLAETAIAALEGADLIHLDYLGENAIVETQERQAEISEALFWAEPIEEGGRNG